jgi:hypothetical protein
MKLHEIMLNSFGIQGVFPFVNKTTAHMCKVLGLINRDKKYYKKKVRERLQTTLSPDIMNQIKKSGNVIDIKHFYNANKSSLVKILHTDCIRNVLTKNQHANIVMDPDKYFSLIFQLAYIYLFNELFITGKYDSQFKDDGFDISLSQITN